MYFPIGWPRQLSVTQYDSPLVHVTASYDRMLLAVLSQNAIGIWFCKPSVEITSFRRSQQNVSDLGVNTFARWKPDTSLLAVSMSAGYIVFYRIQMDKSRTSLFERKEERSLGSQKDDLDNQYVQSIPALTITNSHYVQVPGGVTNMVCLKEELMISTGRGLLQRIFWADGRINTDVTIELASLPFSADLQHSRSSQLSNTSIYINVLEYSPQMGGFLVVLSNGRAAFLASNSLRFEPNQVFGVWAQEIVTATAAAINHKYALMAFGDQSGQGTVYHLDEVTGSLVVSHKLVISCKDFPDAGQVCGAVTLMKWTPDGAALAMAWEKGGFSIWSVFGSLLLHSMGVEAGMSNNDQPLSQPFLKIKSMEWGNEGYHLWMISERTLEDAATPRIDNDATPRVDGDTMPRIDQLNENLNKEVENGSARFSSNPQMPFFLQLNFVKSSMSANPCLSNQVHLLLQGEDRLYLNPEDGLGELSNTSSSSAFFSQQSQSATVGNKQWHVMHLPLTYLAHNWPVRYTAMSASGQWVAVAGRCGLIHYALSSRRWKMFGNETQERDMIVSGGLTWWKDFIVVACYNLVDQRDEIRFYPRDSKLDNTFAHTVRSPSQIVLLNIFVDLVIVLCADCHIVLYNIVRRNEQQAFSEVSLTKLQDIDISNFIPHPMNVVAISLTSLRTDSGYTKRSKDSREAESILINVAGRLLLFQRDRSAAQQSKSTADKEKWLTFTAPVIVASSVESMWLSTRVNHHKPHLTEAFWLGCGAAGMKVWLPLQLKEETGRTKGFLSKRIMLPFFVDIYPLAMLFEAGIILGANSEAVAYPVASSEAADQCWPYLQLERTSQVYLHHILRQLLRRNLGVHALEVARGCTDLLYFPHVLELLIHEVLEEEATSKEPIPDALLPRVVAFVEEFPEYLQTIAHCARKSDVAVWQYFFSVVGNPIELFQECLSTNKLHTAASYLIILQNLEKPSMARQHATSLLDAALDESAWDLARDLVRFLSAIDPSEDKPSGMRRIRQNSQSIYPTHFTTPPISPEDADPFIYSGVMRARSLSKEEPARETGKKKMFTRSDSLAGKSRQLSGHKENDHQEKMNVEAVLDRHARKLLSCYRLYDLARFAANLDDYQLVGWLRKERVQSAKVDDFVSALKKLHEDFHWPFPVVSLSALSRLSSAASLISDQSVQDQKYLKGDVGCTSLQADVSSTSSLSEKSLQFTGMSGLYVNRPKLDDSSQSMGLEHSEASSLMGGEGGSIDSNSWPDLIGSSELEQLTAELANHCGPVESDLQLRYLFQLLMEASCLEWAAIISLVLRDASLFLRVVNQACLPDTMVEVVLRLRNSLVEFETWSNSDCLGYKPFVQSVQSHFEMLKSLEVKAPPVSTRRSSLPKCLSATGSPLDANSAGSLSPKVDTNATTANPLKQQNSVESLESIKNDTPEYQPAEKSSCILS